MDFGNPADHTHEGDEGVNGRGLLYDTHNLSARTELIATTYETWLDATDSKTVVIGLWHKDEIHGKVRTLLKRLLNPCPTYQVVFPCYTARLWYTVIHVPNYKSHVPITSCQSYHYTKPRDAFPTPSLYSATKAANKPSKLAPVTPTRRASAALPEALAEAEAEVPVAEEEPEDRAEVEEPVAVAEESLPVLSEEAESPVA